MSMSLLLGWGAYARDKNTSARLCAKKGGGAGGGLCARAAFLRDTTVIKQILHFYGVGYPVYYYPWNGNIPPGLQPCGILHSSSSNSQLA